MNGEGLVFLERPAAFVRTHDNNDNGRDSVVTRRPLSEETITTPFIYGARTGT